MNKNIILIGMSGAGKTTIGMAMSHKLKMAFLDMDSYIEKKYEMSTTEIFEKYGEEYFRDLESKAAEYIGKNYNNYIISTGGGVVLRPGNMKFLKENGRVVYINRSVENILTTLNADKRPLLKSNPQKLYEMYEKRHELYLKYADICVLNEGEFQDCVENICEVVNNIKK